MVSWFLTGKINMCCKISLNKILAFTVAMTIGVWSAIGFQSYINSAIEITLKTNFKEKENKVKIFKDEQEGTGISTGCYGDKNGHYKTKDGQSIKEIESNVTRIQILNKPKPQYTDEARTNSIQGVVRLRVEFLKNGKIGRIRPVAELPHGLTEQAINAAKKIKFDPPSRYGKPYAVEKVVVYNFTIY